MTLLLLAPANDEVFLFERSVLPFLAQVSSVPDTNILQRILYVVAQQAQSDSMLRMNVDSDMLTRGPSWEPRANDCRDVDHDVGDGRFREVHLTPGRVVLLPLP